MQDVLLLGGGGGSRNPALSPLLSSWSSDALSDGRGSPTPEEHGGGGGGGGGGYLGESFGVLHASGGEGSMDQLGLQHLPSRTGAGSGAGDGSEGDVKAKGTGLTESLLG